jgi:two-component system, NarL family, nitrate/nitrite response regulator NarL
MEDVREEIRVLVVCEHALLRAGLGALIASQPGLRALNDAAGASPTRVLDEAVRLSPDIILADSFCTPPESMREWIANLPNARVIALCASDQHADLLMYLRTGVGGVLTYRASAEELTAAIRSVHQGAVVLQPELVQEVVAQAVQRQNEIPREVLTPREREVLELLVQGLSNKRIAQQLFISVRTVEGRLNSLYAKLGVHSRAEAILVAEHQGWLRRATEGEGR